MIADIIPMVTITSFDFVFLHNKVLSLVFFFMFSFTELVQHLTGEIQIVERLTKSISS